MDNPVFLTLCLTLFYMSTPTKKQSMDSPMDRSDILSILESIEAMFNQCQHVLNSYTQASMLLAITTEAEMLLLKLQVMEKRWNIHPPFKEACNVNFYYWGNRIEELSLAIGGTESEKVKLLKEKCPSKHYLLDLYECLDDSPSHTGGTPYYAETNVSKFVAEQKRLRNLIYKNWNEEYHDKFHGLVARELNSHLEEVLKPVADRSFNIRMTCHTVLRELSIQLLKLHDTPGNIGRDQFARLADRVVEEEDYGGSKAKKTVEHDVKEAQNKIPDDQWEAYRDEEIKVAVDLVKYMKLGNKVFSYLGRDKTMLDNPAGLGKFLWSVRQNISNSDTTNLIELLYRIAVLSRDREQQAAVVPEQQPKPKSAEDVYRQRLAVKPQKPELPKFFNEKLASNPVAVESYYETLHHCGFFIGRTLIEEEKRAPDRRCYAGWKWSHLREAFVRLGFFRADSSKKGFAEHLADVFPYLGATNIQLGFNDRGGFIDDNTVARIIGEIEFEFEDVKEFMEK